LITFSGSCNSNEWFTPTESIHVLHVGKMRTKLCKGKTTIAKEYYSSSM